MKTPMPKMPAKKAPAKPGYGMPSKAPMKKTK
jgi:hypothetical protein